MMGAHGPMLTLVVTSALKKKRSFLPRTSVALNRHVPIETPLSPRHREIVDTVTSLVLCILPSAEAGHELLFLSVVTFLNPKSWFKCF